MKVFFVLLLLLFINPTFAQVDTVRLKNKPGSLIVTDRSPQAIYFQLGGSGPMISAVYDKRFRNKVDGPGFAVGIGYFSISGVSFFSFPVSINYLIGQQNNFLELAAGTTFMTAKFYLFEDPVPGKGFMHHIQIGYRRQPTQGGFFFRGGLSPVLAQGETGLSFYLAIGSNF